MKIKSYKDLIVWQKSIELAIGIFEITKKFPKSELFGLVSQMRRCAFSIPSNIAEGYNRGSRLEYKKFLKISFGSAAELETQLIISIKTQMLLESDYKKLNDQLVEILKMLNKLISTLNTNP